jgi:hypothetical protein
VIAELVAGYRRSASTNQLCQRYDISNGGVLKLLADHRVNMHYQPITDEIKQAIRLYVNGARGLSSPVRRPGHTRSRS